MYIPTSTSAEKLVASLDNCSSRTPKVGSAIVPRSMEGELQDAGPLTARWHSGKVSASGRHFADVGAVHALNAPP
jgi:hypothetical protein